MLALAPDCARLAPAERHALDLLLDLACVLRTDSAEPARCVVLETTGAGDDVIPLGHLAGGITASDGVVRVTRETLRAVHRVAATLAEQQSTERDPHGRVPSAVNALVASSLERRPIVSELALVLADAVRRAAGPRTLRFLAPWPSDARWAVALSHDLDVVEWWPVFTGLRLTELARRLDVPRMLRVAQAAIATGGRDVVFQGVRQVLEIESRHDARSTWFILCGSPTLATARAGDLTYRAERAPARRILAAIADEAHEIGLHGSFATSQIPGVFAEQRARLSSLAETSVAGVRQHYLRMQPGVTEREMQDAGFLYDSTTGFADRNGFRAGVADVFHPWDAARSETLRLAEAPFAWMDRALSKYQGIEDPDVWVDDGLELAERCRAVQGLFVAIWHPNLTDALGFPGSPAAYARLVRELASRGAWLAPLSEIVGWRAMRRTARGVLTDSGDVRLVAADPRLVLEDARGRRVA